MRFVVRMLADGRCRAAIVVACKERFRVGERTVDDYLARMREAWTKRHVASVHSSIRACSSA